MNYYFKFILLLVWNNWILLYTFALPQHLIFSKKNYISVTVSFSIEEVHVMRSKPFSDLIVWNPIGISNVQ